ncbi:PH domain-containing protein [Paenibacillus sp. FSL H8-0548]|uniref:PH domain-containing protein n=1 Tax=Paenibacillus sp. FSL H8-0548 TaxID=1920422 RepID=UPI0015C32601|nr:PH domain-containing protein [Paenibacillus sp. FSL H8-0548]
MNERRTLHPIYILFGLLQTIRGFLPFILIGLVKGTDWTGLNWYWYAGAAALAVVILVFSFLEWRSFGFWLEEDRIIIRKGLLLRDEKTIYYGRIHSVNVEQPLIQRLLGVAQVKIETPGGNKKADGILPALSVKEANDIQLMLRKQANTKTEPTSDVFADATEAAEIDMPADRPLIVKINEKPLMAAPSKVEVSSEIRSVTLKPVQLFQAAATSTNFGLVAAFLAGLYSFADDIINQLLPDHFFETMVEDSSSLMPGYILIVMVGVAVIGFAWLLSVLLYVLKYSGFSVKRDGRQISVSYGLLEKKSFVFDSKKVQAVIVNEGLLRQIFGYAEIQLQIVSSDKKEQLMLHPFLKRSKVQSLLNDFVPQVTLPSNTDLTGAPKRALLYYVRIELLLALVACSALIVFLKTDGLWSLLLIPLLLWWRRSCYVAAGVKLADGQLTLRNRFISRTTYLIRRPQIVTMRVNRSKGQQRKQLLTLSVRALGSPFEYKVTCLDRKDVEPVWRWYSRSQD